MERHTQRCELCKMVDSDLRDGVCRSCAKQLDKGFEKARDYIYDHPRAKILDIVDDTGVDEAIILHLIKSERLELKKGVPIPRCISCGSPIAEGKLCASCRNKMTNSLEGAKNTLKGKGAVDHAAAKAAIDNLAGRQAGKGMYVSRDREDRTRT